MPVTHRAGDCIALVIVLARIVLAAPGLEAVLAAEVDLESPVAIALDFRASHAASRVGRHAVLAVGGTVADEAIGNVEEGTFGAGGALRQRPRWLGRGGA